MGTTQAPPRPRAGLMLALLAFAQFIIAIDYNIVYVALPDIGSGLDFSAQSLQWVVSAYAVGFGGLLLFGGRSVDRLGPRRIFTLAISLYGISSLVGGISDDAGLLVAARAVQGIGGALLFPAVLALLFIGFAEGPERNRAMAIWGATGSAGLAAGSLLGGVLTDIWGWEAVFLVNVPLAAAALVAAPLVLPADPPRNTDLGFDIPGAVLGTAGSTLIVLGLVSGPEEGWTTFRGLGTIAIGVVLLLVFVAVEQRVRNPLAPLRLILNSRQGPTAIIAFLFMCTLAASFYIYTTYLQPVLGYSPLKAGFAFLPVAIATSLGAGLASSILLDKIGLRLTLAPGCFLYGLGVALLVLGMSDGGSFWALVPGIIVWGFGGGMVFTGVFTGAGAGVAPHEQGVASALVSTAQQVGGAMGLAALVAIANHGLDYDHPPGPSASDIVDGLQNAGYVAAVLPIVGVLAALALKVAHHPQTPAAEAAVPATPSPVDGAVVGD
ncbi:MFS transporter [Streptomyces sp. B1866]|uniref:MFS transporter n=1 Tax=Streptomyces sp. B1866 TaxID=3075431 RepID=UPI00288E9199|nr:MFS transporter [Streptomyces sp. B1866]MDT3398011.1 MFS transporter [Streptomyces sp. B1866]